MLLKKIFMVESLLFIGAGASDKNTRSRSKMDRLRNPGSKVANSPLDYYCYCHEAKIRQCSNEKLHQFLLEIKQSLSNSRTYLYTYILNRCGTRTRRRCCRRSGRHLKQKSGVTQARNRYTIWLPTRNTIKNTVPGTLFKPKV